ncbi:MAG: family peptidase [Bacteroidota bacterium]|nr:family peptidase [Bacteroidota bacterium]
MAKLRTKITVILLILFSYNPGYSQLTLDDIYLTGKYVAARSDDLIFLHHQPLFAKLTGNKNGKNISFFNSKNQKINEWKIAAYKNVAGGDWDGLIISNTDKYFMVGSDCEQMYRRSFDCTYLVGDSNSIQPLSTGKQFYPQFSPDDKKVSFIKDNNLFYKENGNEVQITKDGEWNSIINGKSDWVYEEELELTRAYEWNAQSDKIAYLKFDESNVKEYAIPMYYDMIYPNIFSYKYPKSGEENSKVTVWMYDLRSHKNKQIAIPFSYEYIPRIYWNATGDEIMMMLLNRHQDSLQLFGYNVKTKVIRKLYVDASKTYLYVPDVEFLSDNSFIINSDKDGFNHFYHYDKDGKLLQQLTQGNYEVKRIYGVDEKNKLLYYQSNEGNEIETAIYCVNYETLEKKKLSRENGSNNVAFADDYSFFLHNFSSAHTPPVISIEHTDDSIITVIEENKPLKDSTKNLPQKQFIRIPVNGNALNAWIIKPNDFDSSKQYPLFMYVYGGPTEQQVLNTWQPSRDFFFNYLAEKGYIVACVDNRGTAGRGAAFENCIFLNLGKFETADQVASAKYFSSLSYIDKNRIGIFGWSYGAYVSSLCLFEGNDIFKAAIAVGPVANWKLYDDIYTERYMHTVAENPNGYNNYNPVKLASKLKGNLLLIHGTADDNVHFQNTLFLINALNDAHKPYSLYIYPDKEHSISGRQTRLDLFSRIVQFLQDKL